MTRMVDPPPTNNDRVPADETELNRSAKSVFSTGFRGAVDDPELPFSASIAKAVFGEIWNQTPNLALRELFHVAINRLPDDEFPANLNVSWRWLALNLYGYRNDLESRSDGLPHTYKSRYAAIENLYMLANHASDSTTKRQLFRVIRGTLVNVLRDLEGEARQGIFPPTARPVDALPDEAEPPAFEPLSSEAPTSPPESPSEARQSHLVRTAVVVALLSAAGFIAGWFLVPRLYQPELVWNESWRRHSLFVATHFRWIAALAFVLVGLLLLIATQRFRFGRLPRWQGRLAICLVPLVLLTSVGVGALALAHNREVVESTSLREQLLAETLPGWYLTVDEQFNQPNNPTFGETVCANTPADGPGSPSLQPQKLAGDVVPEWCDESNGILRLVAAAWTLRNGYDGGRREGGEGDFYAETTLRSTFLVKMGCGITVVPVGQSAAQQPRHFAFETSDEVPDARVFTYTAAVMTYGPEFSDAYRTTVQRSSLDIPPSTSDIREFDSAPAERWTKLGLLKQGNQYKFFVNDHLMLTHEWVDGPSQVRPQIEARPNPDTVTGTVSCEFDDFKLWRQKQDG